MKQLRARRPVAGIAFSAFDAAADRQRSRAAGFAEHIAKGSTPEALVDAIHRVDNHQTVGV
jgi:CheY-like chemotaxis protein